MASSRQETTQEMARVRQMLEYVSGHLRERQPRRDDPQLESLFEETRETLVGIQREFALAQASTSRRDDRPMLASRKRSRSDLVYGARPV